MNVNNLRMPKIQPEGIKDKPGTVKEIKREKKKFRMKKMSRQKDIIEQVDKKLEEIDARINLNMIDGMQAGFDKIAKAISEAIAWKNVENKDVESQIYQKPTNWKNNTQEPRARQSEQDFQ